MEQQLPFEEELKVGLDKQQREFEEDKLTTFRRDQSDYKEGKVYTWKQRQNNKVQPQRKSTVSFQLPSNYDYYSGIEDSSSSYLWTPDPRKSTKYKDGMGNG